MVDGVEQLLDKGGINSLIVITKRPGLQRDSLTFVRDIFPYHSFESTTLP